MVKRTNRRIDLLTRSSTVVGNTILRHLIHNDSHGCWPISQPLQLNSFSWIPQFYLIKIIFMGEVLFWNWVLVLKNFLTLLWPWCPSNSVDSKFRIMSESISMFIECKPPNSGCKPNGMVDISDFGSRPHIKVCSLLDSWFRNVQEKIL